MLWSYTLTVVPLRTLAGVHERWDIVNRTARATTSGGVGRPISFQNWSLVKKGFVCVRGLLVIFTFQMHQIQLEVLPQTP